MGTLTILFYNTLWDAPLPFKPDDLLPGCSVTTDHTQLSVADAVVFHLPDLHRYMDREEIIKPEGQIWVAWSLECEENYPWMKTRELRENFDIWMGYHQQDTILHTYYEPGYEELLQRAPLHKAHKNKACMFISSTVNQSRRCEYLSELMKYTEIDSYGKLFNNKTITGDKGTESLLATISEYKFVIAFENAVADDYVTEKFYNPLLCGTVPVYRGAPNIEDFSPGENCFVDARNFASPRELAAHMEACYRDNEVYEHYRQWRKMPLSLSFKKKLEQLQTPLFTRLCMKIQEIKRTNLQKSDI